MKILRIEIQKKDKSRYSIFTEDGFLTGISEDTLVKYGFRKGDEIDAERLVRIAEEDEKICARRDAYEFLSYKPRTKTEVTRKLRSKKYSEAAITNAIELLTQQKYIDDIAYVRDYVSRKIRMKPEGTELLRRKLLRKGVEKQIISEVLEELIDEDKSLELAMITLEKHFVKRRETDLKKFKEKSYRYLVMKGFESDTAVETINRYIERSNTVQSQNK